MMLLSRLFGKSLHGLRGWTHPDAFHQSPPVPPSTKFSFSVFFFFQFHLQLSVDTQERVTVND